MKRKSLQLGLALLLSIGALSGLTSCAGYSLQSSDSAHLRGMGILRVYVRPVRNDTYKPGVENLVYNAMVKQISARRQLKLVERPEDSDAELIGVVTNASRTTTSVTAADTLPPVRTGRADMLVAREYTAQLGCTFALERWNPGPKQPKSVWGANFTRAKAFPANNQLGVLGTTSPLINESEFDRALGDLAEMMMRDVHETMSDLF